MTWSISKKTINGIEMIFGSLRVENCWLTGRSYDPFLLSHWYTNDKILAFIRSVVYKFRCNGWLPFDVHLILYFFVNDCSKGLVSISLVCSFFMQGWSGFLAYFNCFQTFLNPSESNSLFESHKNIVIWFVDKECIYMWQNSKKYFNFNEIKGTSWYRDWLVS